MARCASRVRAAEDVIRPLRPTSDGRRLQSPECGRTASISRKSRRNHGHRDDRADPADANGEPATNTPCVLVVVLVGLFLGVDPSTLLALLGGLSADFSSASLIGLGKQFIPPVFNLIILHDAFQKERV